MKKENIRAVILAPNPECNSDAMAHINDLRYLSLDQIVDLVNRTLEAMDQVRTRFGGSDFASHKQRLRSLLKRNQVDFKAIAEMFDDMVSSYN